MSVQDFIDGVISIHLPHNDVEVRYHSWAGQTSATCLVDNHATIEQRFRNVIRGCPMLQHIPVNRSHCMASADVPQSLASVLYDYLIRLGGVEVTNPEDEEDDTI